MLHLFKKYALCFCLALLSCFSAFTLHAGTITGAWYGTLHVQGIKLRLVLHIEQAAGGYAATMDSPDQGAKGLPLDKVAFEDGRLDIAATQLGMEYTGLLKDNVIKGTFRQGGGAFPLDFSREETVGRSRPQEPVKPFPYREEEVRFDNKAAGISLAGTLTLPQGAGRFPAVILISGSGPQDRNETLLGHKPFEVIADHLSRNGFAVLRYDDRGVAGSGGVFQGATSADFATDADAAFRYLQGRKEIDGKRIGLMGHSEGGLIAPMVASKNRDVAFVVLLAGPGTPGKAILLAQQKLIARASGVPEAEIEKSNKVNAHLFELATGTGDTGKVRAELEKALSRYVEEVPSSGLPQGVSREQLIQQQMAELTSPWMLYFLAHDPAADLQKLTCPVLALNGEKDLQVPAAENLAAIKKYTAAGGNRQVTVKELKGLNHLFQECTTGAPAEYENIEQTFSPVALQEILSWLQAHVRR